ncbi:hypothetical protein [Streptomyces platensis]|uniref:hypothetical protein n=1 Tax=Streptomyces platensis TaxID=58346 RepID=UPI002E14F23B|nr:hypothetical protein OG229_19645 [Streptomyces platensis]WUB81134.1 hypothetical protein OG424_19255 [Streptomyces platensis]
MRNGFTPAIDTCEIADNELDNIAGGLASAGAEVAGHGAAVSVGGVVETAGSLASNVPVGQVAGMATVETTGF